MKKITVVEIARKHQLFQDETKNQRLIYAGEVVKKLYVNTFKKLPPMMKVKENGWTIKVRSYPTSFEPVILRCLKDYDRYLAGEKIQEIRLNIVNNREKPVMRVMRERRKNNTSKNPKKSRLR